MSGNREVIEDENPSIQAPATAAVTASEEKKEIPFKKPVVLQEHMKTTPIKEVLEKYQPSTQQEEAPAETSQTTPQTDTPELSEQPIVEENTAFSEENNTSPKEDDIINVETETDIEEVTETVFSSLQDCWTDAVKEAATEDMMIAEEMLSKLTPAASKENSIEINVSNEVAKQEVRQILPTLTQCLLQKTGIPYSIEIKVVKVEQERQVDTANPDEKFKSMCQENPKLLEFKQRLNLSIS